MNIHYNHGSIRIAINAQLSPSSGAGGVVSVLIGLIAALGKLDDGNEEYIIVGPWKDYDWLSPYLGANQKLIRGPNPETEQDRPFNTLPSRLRPFAKLINKWLIKFLNIPSKRYEIPLSNGFYENLGCDLIHFPYQDFVLCALPSIYNPHDLLHLHYPQFFTPGQLYKREILYRAGCNYAQTIVVGSEWIKNDLIYQYSLNPQKVQVIPWGVPSQHFPKPTPELLKNVIIKYNLPEKFAFYPAMLWPHKNHKRLIDAVAYLRDKKGIKINLICTGNPSSNNWNNLLEHVARLNLQSQVKFLGIVPYQEIRAIYKLANFVIIPTLFEAASGPVFEAWEEEIPVACSEVTSLPEQVGNAALLFNPFSVEEISIALEKMTNDERMRRTLIENGKKRLGDFSWELTANAYRAVYRRTLGFELSDYEKALLNWDWMKMSKSIREDNPCL